MIKLVQEKKKRKKEEISIFSYLVYESKWSPYCTIFLDLILNLRVNSFTGVMICWDLEMCLVFKRPWGQRTEMLSPWFVYHKVATKIKVFTSIRIKNHLVKIKISLHCPTLYFFVFEPESVCT